MNMKIAGLTLALLTSVFAVNANAGCQDISRGTLQTVVNNVRASDTTGGLKLDMWITVVNETGLVCYVVNTGVKGSYSGNQQWLGSRIISAQKANTGNAFSLDTLAISSGALYAAVQPGGSLYGLQESNPVNATVAYNGDSRNFGKQNDPIVGIRIGGINVFGGGLPLYKNGKKIGGIGVSGDTSCTDHAFAWAVRHNLGLEPGSGVGLVEKLKLTNTFAALGDHPSCIGAAITDQSGFQAAPAP